MEHLRPAERSPSSACVACGADLADARCDHCGAVARAGPYTVLRVLSASPHGRIYLAEDEHGARVALKELVYTLVPSTLELDAFEREAALLKQLQHPRIPRFVNSFSEGSGARTRLYLAQQYVAGESLAQRLEAHRFDQAEVEGLARQALELLHWLHTRTPPVVHRDVKPANLVLAPDGALHLVDFGAARDVRALVTHRSTLVGTVGYIAPEQLGGTSGPRSDLYALGATLLHLLTGKPPEQLASSGIELDLSQVAISARLRRFLERLVAAKAADRFQSAGEALQALRDGVPLRKGQRRMPLVLAVAGAVSLAAAALLSVMKSPAAEVVAPVAEPARPAQLQPAPTAPAPTRAASAVLHAPAMKKEDFPNYRSEAARWDFHTPGPTLVDRTGNGHSVAYPTEDYTYDFFGMNFTGGQKMVLPDSPDFAPSGPFVISAHVQLPEGPIVATQHLITRSGADGSLAWDLAIEPGDRLRFTLSDGAGKTSTAEATVPLKRNSSFLIYAEFDPETGDQWLFQCAELAHVVTTLRPPKVLTGGVVRLLDGFRGHALELSVGRGLMLPTPGGSAKCAFTSAKTPR